MRCKITVRRPFDLKRLADIDVAWPPGRLNEALPQIEAKNHPLKIRNLSHLQSFLYLDDTLILLHIRK
jgi:hypothetical protein